MKKFRNFIAWMLFIGGIVAGLYFGGYVMFIKAIILFCQALDAGLFTWTLAGWTLIKCFCASMVGITIALLGLVLFSIVYDRDK